MPTHLPPQYLQEGLPASAFARTAVCLRADRAVKPQAGLPTVAFSNSACYDPGGAEPQVLFVLTRPPPITWEPAMIRSLLVGLLLTTSEKVCNLTASLVLLWASLAVFCPGAERIQRRSSVDGTPEAG